MRYICLVCNYIYDPKIGDQDHDIKPGTSFNDLPETWVCPICGVPKSEFAPEE
jgi:rubredoxin